MFDMVFLAAGVVILTVLVYLLVIVGTKEKSFEEAVAEQKQQREHDHEKQKADKHSKKSKIKKGVKGKENPDVPQTRGRTYVEPEAEIQHSEHESTPTTELDSESSMPLQTTMSSGHLERSNVTVRSRSTTASSSGDSVPQPKLCHSCGKPGHISATCSFYETYTPEYSQVDSESIPSHKLEPEPSPSPQPSVSQGRKKNKRSPKSEKIEEYEVPQKKVEEEIIMEKKSVAPLDAQVLTYSSASSTISETKPLSDEVRKEKINEAIQIKAQEIIEAQVQTSVTVERTNIVDRKPKKEREQKREKSTKSEGAELTKLLMMIEKTHLTETEMQSLIEALLQLDAGGVGGEWEEKGRIDHTTQLKRQLEEMEGRSKEQKEAHNALSAKIADLRSELNNERAKTSQTKRQLETISTQHQKQLEVAGVNARDKQSAAINELKSTLEQEYQDKLQQQQQQYEITSTDSKQTQQQIQILKASVSESDILVTVARQEHDDLIQRCQKYEEHIKLLEEKHTNEDTSKASHIKDLKSQSAAADAARSEALSQATKLATEKDQLSLQISQLTKDGQREHLTITKAQQSLQEALREKNEIQDNLTDVQTELISVQQKAKDQSTQIECLKEEKESLASQSVRPAAEGQENGDVHSEQISHISTSSIADSTHLQSLESLLKEKDQLIERCNTDVVRLQKDVSRLTDEIDKQTCKNNELRNKNTVVHSCLTSTEDSLKARLLEDSEKCKHHEEENQKTRAVLRRLFPLIKVEDNLEQHSFLAHFESKAESQQKPEPQVQVVEKIVEKVVENPELKRIVEDLKKENDRLKSRMDNQLGEQKQKEKELLQQEEEQKQKQVQLLKQEEEQKQNQVQLLKQEEEQKQNQVQLLKQEEEQKQKQQQLVQQEEEHKHKLSQLSVDNNSTSDNVVQLEQKNKDLEGKVQHYQTVLEDTESLLKNLQSSVDWEEGVWKNKLEDKECCLRQLNADKAYLQVQVKQLEQIVDKAKKSDEVQDSQLKDSLLRLQQELQKEEKEKSTLQLQLTEAQQQLATTASQTNSSSSTTSSSDTQLQDDNDKLRVLVNVGQQSHRQQEQLIEELQIELTTVKQNVSANGPSSAEQCADSGHKK